MYKITLVLAAVAHYTLDVLACVTGVYFEYFIQLNISTTP